MSLSRTVGALLRASVARPPTSSTVQDVLASMRPEDADGLAAAAWYHGIAGYTYAALASSTHAPPRELAGLKALRERIVLRHLTAVADLRVVHRVFTSAGVPWLVVKGPTLALPVHGSAALRSYSDLDVLVPPRAFIAALAALEHHGCPVLDRNWTLIHREMKGEVHVRLPNGTTLDLHWNLLNDRVRREEFPLDVDRVFDHRDHVQVGGLVVPTLSPADTVVYVAIHTMLSGGHRLVWLKDLSLLLEQERAAPDEVVDRARSWAAELVLTSAIQRTARSLGQSPQGRELLSQSRRRHVWSAVNHGAFHLSPAERQDGAASLGRIVARSASSTQVRSLRRLGAKSLRRFDHGSPFGEDGPRRLAPDDPRSDQYDSGGPATRKQFAEAVVATSTKNQREP